MIAFSISVGSYSVLGSLLSAFVLEYFEVLTVINLKVSINKYIYLQNAQEDAGRMGLVMILAGIIGTPIVGYVLDKTHRFK